MGLACNFDVLNDAFDTGETQLPLKEFVSLRKYWDGDFTPLAPASRGQDVWAAYRLDLAGSGFCAFFRRQDAPETETFSLAALDPDAEYEITLSGDDFNKTAKRVRGSDLGSFEARIPNAGGSLILTYRKL